MNVALVNTDRMWVERFRKALSSQASLFVAESCSAPALLRFTALQPDVICFTGTPALLANIHARWPAARLVIIESNQRWAQATWREWLNAGAVGLIQSTAGTNEIQTALRTAASGAGVFIPSRMIAQWITENDAANHAACRTLFSTAEWRIAELLPTSLSYKEIAARLGIQSGTAHSHIIAIYRKLHVHSRGAAVTRLTVPSPDNSPSNP
jgi:DNA-binding NarL/FixJ family response regulator